MLLTAALETAVYELSIKQTFSFEKQKHNDTSLICLDIVNYKLHEAFYLFIYDYI